MSILRSPDCINSSDSHFHSSAPSRIETFVISPLFGRRWPRCGAPEGWQGACRPLLKHPAGGCAICVAARWTAVVKSLSNRRRTGRSTCRKFGPVVTCVFASNYAKRWPAPSRRDPIVVIGARRASWPTRRWRARYSSVHRLAARGPMRGPASRRAS